MIETSKIGFYKEKINGFLVEDNMLNYLDILHGGELIKRLDTELGYIASQYAKSRVLTVSIKNFNFILPINKGRQIYYKVTLFDTGRTTMKFYVEVFSSSVEGYDNKKVATGYFLFVAVNEEKKPITIPSVVYEDQVSTLQVKDIAQTYFKEFPK